MQSEIAIVNVTEQGVLFGQHAPDIPIPNSDALGRSIVCSPDLLESIKDRYRRLPGDADNLRLPLGAGHLGVDLLWMPPGSSFPYHTHPAHHVLYVVAGLGTLEDEHHVIRETQPGDVLMVPGYLPHAVGAQALYSDVERHGGPGQWILAFGAPHVELEDPARMTLIPNDSIASAPRGAAVEVRGLVVTDEDVLRTADAYMRRHASEQDVQRDEPGGQGDGRSLGVVG